MSDMIKVSICDGKYTIIQDSSGRTNVLRYGESWRDATGDNVVLGAAYEIEKLQSRIQRLEETLDNVKEVMKLPASNRRLMQIAGPARQVINIVNQAKENKP